MRALILLLAAAVFNNGVLPVAAHTEGVAPPLAMEAFEDKAYGSIVGVVVERNTGKPLAGVNITVEGSRRGTTTNQRGEFNLAKLLVGRYSLTFDYIGYAKRVVREVAVEADQTTNIEIIDLTEQPIDLKEVVVTPGSYSLLGSEASVRQTLTSDDIKIMGWAEDLTRAVQRVPGISGNDFTAKFNIRGGDVDEVLVLLDGMRIYKPFHQKDFGGGLFSTVDIETIGGLDLLTGGFTAEYGDRMSGVLDLRSKSPTDGRRHTSLGFSLMNIRAFSMGPLNGSKGSWLVSARRGYLDIVNSLMGNQFKLRPRYYDMMAKFEYQVHAKHTLSVHAFLADDAYTLNERVVETPGTSPNVDFIDTDYGNNYGWLSLKSFLSPKLYARTLLYVGSVTQRRFWDLFDDDPEGNLNSGTINDNRDLKLFGIKQDWSYEASEGLFLKAGANLKRFNVDFAYSKEIFNEFIAADGSLIDQVAASEVDRTEDASQVGLYLSSRFQVLSPLTVETGLRYDYASYSGDKLWSPRVNLVYALGRTTFLRAGWGHFYQSQNIDDLRIEFDEAAYLPAELSKHYVVGLEHLFENGLKFRAEGYLKQVNDLRDRYVTFRNIDEFFPESRDDLIKLVVDDATTKGLEFYLKYDTGNKFSWWLSYVLSDAKDDILDIEYDGRLIKQTGKLPRFWDQRHTVNLDVNFRPNRAWHFNFAWQYRSGWPHTPFEVRRVGRGDGTFAFYHDYGLFNSRRYPAYHRLDIRTNKHFYTSKGRITAFLHIINSYNHTNVNNFDFSIRESNAETFRFEIDTETWFSILPFIGVSWEF